MVGKAGDTSELAMMVHRVSDVAISEGMNNAELLDGSEIATSYLFTYLMGRLSENHGVNVVMKTLRGILSLGPSLIPIPKVSVRRGAQ